ncbi:uncharacterized protein N7477_003554 [Penicillium maclennaniae]|uniref:uncharacterized protein n=1 Tax=Penicillium maclennaniae TaxID=1343394 RepID=UPI0025425D96|nr:uncharacterized protein N7477_003554 [Penicillium maclennaniae]KAJ5677921.1 hypothetical protein N7477_003554 [Penicillium maclennaniae]
MESLDRPFTIQIDDEYVTRVEDDSEYPTHASVGSEPAVFTLKNSVLECDGWYLGRHVIEDRSLMPKRILWFKVGEQDPGIIQPTLAEPEGDSYKLVLGGM